MSLESTIVQALITGSLSAAGLYLGMNLSIDRLISKMDKRLRASPITQRIEQLLIATEKVTGNDQAIEQITNFFKEARELTKSQEVKNLLITVTDLIKELSSKETSIKLELPTKPVVEDTVNDKDS